MKQDIVVGLTDVQKIALFNILSSFLPKKEKIDARTIINQTHPSFISNATNNFMYFVNTQDGLNTSISIHDLLKSNNPNDLQLFNNNNKNNNNINHDNEPPNNWFKRNGLYFFKNDNGEVVESPTDLIVLQMIVLGQRQSHLEDFYRDMKLIEQPFLDALNLIVEDRKPTNRDMPGILNPPFHYLSLIKVVSPSRDSQPKWALFHKESKGYEHFIIKDFDDCSEESIKRAFPDLILLGYSEDYSDLPISDVYDIAIRYKQPIYANDNLKEFLSNNSVGESNMDAIMSLVNAISFESCYSPIDTLAQYIWGNSISDAALQQWDNLNNVNNNNNNNNQF